MADIFDARKLWQTVISPSFHNHCKILMQFGCIETWQQHTNGNMYLTLVHNMWFCLLNPQPRGLETRLSISIYQLSIIMWKINNKKKSPHGQKQLIGLVTWTLQWIHTHDLIAQKKYLKNTVENFTDEDRKFDELHDRSSLSFFPSFLRLLSKPHPFHCQIPPPPLLLHEVSTFIFIFILLLIPIINVNFLLYRGFCLYENFSILL